MAQVEVIAANLKQNTDISVKSNMKKVCAYCRVSTDSEEQLTSYSSQIKHYSEMIKSNPEWEFVGIYADEGITGTKIEKRNEFIRMVEDALSGKIDIIIAKSISRFARNTVDSLQTCRKLREHNIDVYFEKENIHTLNLDSEMFLTLYSAFAQAESESISMNVKMGIKAKMKRGEFISNAGCYGFNWNKLTKNIEINEEKAEVVRKIFNWYASGIGSHTIAKRLNKENIPSPKGKKWIPTTIRKIIRNEKYVGDLLSQKTYTISPISHKIVVNFGEKEKYYSREHHIAIIDRNTWNKAQEIYNKRSRIFLPNGCSEHNNKYSVKYPFSSKIVCGLCGNNFVRRINSKRKDGTSKIYWACSRRITYHNDCKESFYITEDNLKEMFIQIYNSLVEKKHKTKDKLLNAIKETLNNNDIKEKMNKLQKEKLDIENRLSNLIDMKLEDYVNKEVYIKKEKELNEQLSKVKKDIIECENINDEKKNVSHQIEEIEEILNSKKTIKEFDRDTFDNLVDKIIIGKKDEDGTITPNIINFVLKIGTEYQFEINNDKNVSLRTKKMVNNTI